MAAYCPKCNYKLRVRDWRPECPQCGVNILYYGVEDKLREEADIAEREHAITQPKYDRAKAALIGHPLAIVRIILCLLPIAAALLPMGTVSYVIPFNSTVKNVNLISVVTYFVEDGLDFNLLTKLFGSDIVGTGFICWAVAVAGLVLAVLTALAGLIVLFLSCSPKGYRRNLTIASMGIVFTVAAQIGYIMMIKSFSAELPGIFSGTVQPWGCIGMVVAFAAVIAVNVIYKKKNVQVKYKDVSEFLIPYAERESTKAKKQAQAEAAQKTASSATDK